MKLRIGKKKISDKDNFIPNNLNPIFGRYARSDRIATPRSNVAPLSSPPQGV